MSSSPAVYKEPFVPNPITEADAQKWKQKVRNMVKGHFKDFYPEVVLSYASGRRPGDAEGTGPGFVQAFQFITLLLENGYECFSGLHIPPGENWETFFLRLNGDKAKAKVFIALLDYAYFQSIPCMKELHMAIKAKVQIVLVRMEGAVKEDGELKEMPPPEKQQWEGEMVADDELKRSKARECVASRNAIPHPGTLLTVPETFDEILNTIRERCKLDLPTNNGIFESHSSSEQVAEGAQVKALAIESLRVLASLLVLFARPQLPHPPMVLVLGLSLVFVFPSWVLMFLCSLPPTPLPHPHPPFSHLSSSSTLPSPPFPPLRFGPTWAVQFG